MDLKKKIEKAPQSPGVYLFKNARGSVLYVGKAANLRARLKSYTRPGWKDDMVRDARRVSWEELSSDVEALIRESELIKKLKPRYNILMRDNKQFVYVAITKETYPRITITRKRVSSGAEYIGPFTDVGALRRTLTLLRRAFPYCTCSYKKPHKRKCVNGEIGKCMAFCCADIPHSKKDILTYKQHITSIKKVLTGKTKTLTRTLIKKMDTAAKKQDYEAARTYRDQITSLERVFQHQPYLKKDIQEERIRGLHTLKDILKLLVIPHRIEGYDISHHHGESTVASMVVFEDGIPNKSEYKKFNVRTVRGVDDFKSMNEVLTRRIKHSDWPRPDVIIIDGGKGQLSAAQKALGSKKIPIASIAKREEELYVLNRKDPFPLKALPEPLLHLITHIRDESHRFAISFHRKKKRRGRIDK